MNERFYPKNEKRGIIPNNEEIKKILNGDYELLVRKAEELGRHLERGGVKTSQFRRIFGEIKKMYMKGFNESTLKELLLLKPRLSYTAERHRQVRPLKDLRDILNKMIDEIVRSENEEKFKNFVNFVEAAVAYHKGYGGKD